jgi:glyoxylase-like metal-dependent hydrolase (beta-lactamase superfamily II)
MRLEEAMPQVFRVAAKGASVFLLSDERITLIDAGMRGSGRRILRAVKEIGRSPEDIAQVIVTHYHYDHIGGLAELRRETSARTAAHRAEAPFISGDMRLPFPIRRRVLAAVLEPLATAFGFKPRPVPVDIILDDGDELPALGGMRVVHCPGHTPGHIVLHFPRRGLLIVGDALQAPGGRLTPPAAAVTEDMAAARRSIARMAELDVEVICFSHFRPLREGAAEQLRELAARLQG